MTLREQLPLLREESIVQRGPAKVAKARSTIETGYDPVFSSERFDGNGYGGISCH